MQDDLRTHAVRERVAWLPARLPVRLPARLRAYFVEGFVPDGSTERRDLKRFRHFLEFSGAILKHFQSFVLLLDSIHFVNQTEHVSVLTVLFDRIQTVIEILQIFLTLM